ncbi:MAG TPA: methyltransferase domain-containing protein [Gaiellaceae bacterium]|nr:methyltransferase domain-containing protein [Gaiellaceae bacterium]
MSECPVCGAPGAVAAHAVLAPFVAELTGLEVGRATDYLECPDCGLGFFGLRYDDAQVERLYGAYRGPEYVRVRRRWEPWYREAVNEAYEPGSAGVAERVAFESELLAEAGLEPPLRCALDFGGDAGQFFPDVEIGRRLVVDVSERPLLAGVERIESLAALPEAPDLVVIAHVLEHLSEPRPLLAEIRERIAPGGTLYVEVPLDRPRVRRWHARPGYRRWLALIARRRPLFVLCDFAGGVARQFGRRIPRLAVVKESEHLNCFDRRSLRRLLESAGFEVRAERADPNARTGGLRLGKLGMAAVAPA